MHLNLNLFQKDENFHKLIDLFHVEFDSNSIQGKFDSYLSSL